MENPGSDEADDTIEHGSVEYRGVQLIELLGLHEHPVGEDGGQDYNDEITKQDTPIGETILAKIPFNQFLYRVHHKCVQIRFFHYIGCKGTNYFVTKKNLTKKKRISH
jgi:hypothetical protein